MRLEKGLWSGRLPGSEHERCDVSSAHIYASHPAIRNVADARVRSCGKLLRVNGERWYVKGLTYGPFSPDTSGQHFPPRRQMLHDFAHIQKLGGNAIRLYHLPSRSLLDDAIEHGLRVLIDVPWEKHRCFFEDVLSRREALRRVQIAASELGSHPAVFGISVANEIPKDVVRFYGARRVEQFIDSLIDALKQEAPDCLATYTNYPSTEFLSPARLDFYCANVYLEDSRLLGGYLDRLQHVAGALPLVLGEYGVDSLRTTPARQADLLAQHVERVFHHGLAGSFVFSYTDDWFTSGHRVNDWAFGITDRHRVEKPAAGALSRVWAQPPIRVAGQDVNARAVQAPRVSVVVCSYNGGATLSECLESLLGLDYPDYEIILVDDGSTDNTPQIAALYPQVKTIHQKNAGLSAARNVGALAATGQVIAYTDSDCVADEAWLLYLVSALREQGVDAVGGPNVAPASDGWVARCVAASPGGPSHVMLDDRRAEHVPGCNMAFWRDRLEAIGGFDPQFRQAGDDVDICWRFLDAGLTIGYAPAALVWHHRRTSVRAYCLQQKGYGRAEAMLHFKHARRFNALGCSRWNGIIYGDGSVRPAPGSPAVYHGRFGSALFQIVYRRNDVSLWTYCTLFEWHALMLFCLSVTPVFPAAAALVAVMLALSVIAAARQAARAVLPGWAPWWCRPLIGGLHLLQPPLRAWHRHAYRLRHGRLVATEAVARAATHTRDAIAPAPHYGKGINRVFPYTFDLYWESHKDRGREGLLHELVDLACRAGWPGDFHAEWETYDVELCGTTLHNVRLRTATEELGSRRRFTRVRCALRTTMAARVMCAGLLTWTVAAGLWTGSHWTGAGLIQAHFAAILPLAVVCLGWVVLAISLIVSTRRCRESVAALVSCAAASAGLDPVVVVEATPTRRAVFRSARARDLDGEDTDDLATAQVA